MSNGQKLSLAEQNRLRTTEKVVEALEKLKKGKAPITIKSVCEKAEIARKTIYNRPDLKAMVEEAQSLQNDLSSQNKAENKKRGSLQAERLNKLIEANKALKDDKKKLLEQNMILTKRITQLENRLVDLEDKLYSKTQLKVIDFKNQN